jgi:hypothetical protein
VSRAPAGDRAISGDFSENSRADETAAEIAGRIDDVLTLLKTHHSQHSLDLGLFAAPGGLDGRIAHLEASTAHLARDVAQISTDVRDIRERLHRLQERSSQRPGKGLLAVSTAAILIWVATAPLLQPQIEPFVSSALSLDLVGHRPGADGLAHANDLGR